MMKHRPRPPSRGDVLYEHEDFASPEDLAEGRRPHAPQAPTAANAGALLSEARRRYEREWATELEDVKEGRMRASDVGRRAPAGTATSGATASAAAKSAGGHNTIGLPKFIDRTGAKGGYITVEGNKMVPKGRAIWRALGRTPSRILKEKHMPEATRVLGVRERKGRRRNVGSGLEYEEAADKWFNWYRKNKGPGKIEKVFEAGSPKLEDVEAEYEERKARRGNTRARTERKSAQDERTGREYGSRGRPDTSPFDG